MYVFFQYLVVSPFCSKASVKSFQSSAAFHKETSQLICSANQMIGLYMKCNTGLKVDVMIWKRIY